MNERALPRGEFEWINFIRSRLGSVHHGGKGIGDDAAILPSRLLWTTDALVEGVHFLSSWPMHGVGYKSLACNVSDIAAMGGRPLYALLTTGLPPSYPPQKYADFLEGFKQALDDFDIDLMGGDTVRSNDAFFSISLLGEVIRRPLLRSGAQVNDFIYVSGYLGESSLGLQTLLEKIPPSQTSDLWVKRHLYPEPRLSLIGWLSEHFTITAAIDCSDGFLADLEHIAEESQKGYEIYLDKLPTPRGITMPKNWQETPWEFVFAGGEDYEIIFTSPNILPSEGEGIPITCVGKIIENDFRLLWKNTPLPREAVPRGFTHF